MLLALLWPLLRRLVQDEPAEGSCGFDPWVLMAAFATAGSGWVR